MRKLSSSAIFSTILLMFISLSMPSMLFAQNASEELLVVTATGYGRSAKEAEKDALRAAVQKAVGVYVQSTTMTDNEELITDQILTASNGIVQEYVPFGEPTLNTTLGLYELKITAKVIKKALLNKLDEAKITYSVPMAGQSLFAQATTMQMQKADAQALFDATWDEIYNKNLDKLFRIRLLGLNGETGEKFAPSMTNNKDGTVKISFYIEYSYNFDYWYTVVAPKWSTVLDLYAKEKLPNVRSQLSSNGYSVSFPVEESDPQRESKRWVMSGAFIPNMLNMSPYFEGEETKSGFILNLAIAQDRLGSSVEYSRWLIPDLSYSAQITRLQGRYISDSGITSINRLDRFSVVFLDKDGLSILEEPLIDLRRLGYLKYNKSQSESKSDKFVVPYGPSFYMSNMSPYFIDRAYRVLMKTILYQYSANFTTDALKEVVSIKVRYNPIPTTVKDYK